MYAMRELVKCAPYWDALFDENEQAKITPDRLRELVEADREGRCVVLPCKVGDTVFRILDGEVKKLTVKGFRKELIGNWKIAAFTDPKYQIWTGCEIDFSEIGETVFLTREAAEVALRGN